MAMQLSVNPSRTLCLFDVDNTLTPARKAISREMEELLARLRHMGISIGFVGASDFATLSRQLAPPTGKNVMERFDFGFAENGLTAYSAKESLGTFSFLEFVGEELYQDLVGFVMEYIAKLRIPKKRDVFIELRTGMMYVTPMGRSAKESERKEFEMFDRVHNVRKKFIEALQQKLDNHGNEKMKQFTIMPGGEISIEIVPKGWDKTYCLQHIERLGFQTIHFFGDKTRRGGNDYEIFKDTRTEGHAVKDPEDTLDLVGRMFGSQKS